jgi:hypothetical protein
VAGCGDRPAALPRTPPNAKAICEHAFVAAQGSVYSQFKRALKRRNFMLAWTMAAELPKVQLADARLCMERQLSASEAQLALAALNALPGPGATSAAPALAAVCERHSLDAEARVIQDWLESRREAQ